MGKGGGLEKSHREGECGVGMMSVLVARYQAGS